jgi:hypothetical protein
MRIAVPGRPVPAPRMTEKEIAMATRGVGRNAARIQRYHAWRDAAKLAALAAHIPTLGGPVRITVDVHVSGRQVIMITHHSVLADTADRCLRVSKRDEKSEVSEA